MMRRIFAFGGVVIGVGLLILATPRAAHAVAAALVQVTNTAANPAIVQDVNGQAAPQLDVTCYGAAPGLSEPCATVSGSGTYSAFDFAVPANQTLVVTAVDLSPSGSTQGSCSAWTQVALTTNGSYRKIWTLVGSGTTHLSYPSGLLVSAGQSMQVYNAPASGCTVQAEFHGYLTAN